MQQKPPYNQAQQKQGHRNNQNIRLIADLTPDQHPIPEWQQILTDGFQEPSDLLAALQLRPDQFDATLNTRSSFKLRVPAPFVSRMEPGNAKDPLLLQILTSSLEDVIVPGFQTNPLSEAINPAVPGMLRKYQGRVLLMATGACAVHCRYCFRRHFPYSAHIPGKNSWQPTLDRIAADSSIHEVILSGGDPLMLNDEQLARLIAKLNKISHVETLRIHTRTPVVIPQRITPDLCALLRQWRGKTVVVLHLNHSAEIDDLLKKSLHRLAKSVDHLFNQSVLLAGVNDDLDSLAQLSRKLFACSVLPYYLHQLDRVQGAAHFLVTDQKANMLMGRLRDTLPGYLVPALVREIPGMGSKQLVAK